MANNDNNNIQPERTPVPFTWCPQEKLDVNLTEDGRCFTITGKRVVEMIGQEIVTEGSVYWEIEIVHSNRFVHFPSFGLVDSKEPFSVGLSWDGNTYRVSEFFVSDNTLYSRCIFTDIGQPGRFFDRNTFHKGNEPEKYVYFKTGDKLGVLLDWKDRFVEFYHNSAPYIKLSINTEVKPDANDFCQIDQVPTGFRPVFKFDGRSKTAKMSCRFVTPEDNKRKATDEVESTTSKKTSRTK